MEQRKKPSIFREQSLERISSDEDMRAYLKGAGAELWIVLTAITLLLIGAIAWAYFSHLETTVSAPTTVSSGEATIYVSSEVASALEPGMEVRVSGENASSTLASVDTTLQTSGEAGSAISAGQTYCTASAPLALADGSYEAIIIIKSVTPLSFLFN